DPEPVGGRASLGERLGPHDPAGADIGAEKILSGGLRGGRRLVSRWHRLTIPPATTTGHMHGQALNQRSISRLADSSESEAWMRFCWFDSEKSPRIVPDCALRPSVAPEMARTTGIASSPAAISATSGPEV